MFALGLPISQGALSTILGVLGLYLSPSYIFVTFFKMVFLVIVLGALHGLLLLPVLLSLFGPGSCESKLGDRSKRADEATKLGKSEPADYQMSAIEMRRHSAVSAPPPPELRIPRPLTKLSSPPSGNIATATALSALEGPEVSGRRPIKGGSENGGYVDPDNV